MSWGGAREGAGRKKAEVPKKIRGMRVTDDEWVFLKDALDKYRSGETAAPVSAPIEAPSQVQSDTEDTYKALVKGLLAHLENLYYQDEQWLLEYKQYLQDESYDKHSEDEIEYQRELIHSQIVTLSTHLTKLPIRDDIKISLSVISVGIIHASNREFGKKIMDFYVKAWKEPEDLEYQSIYNKLLKTYEARCSLQQEIQILEKNLHRYDW